MRASTTYVSVDARTTDHAGAEHVVHLLDALLPSTDPTYVASTHVVTTPTPHTAVTASWSSADWADAAPGPLLEHLAARLRDAFSDVAVVLGLEDGTATRAEQLLSSGAQPFVAGALHAAAEHRGRSTGRLSRYPGRADIERRITVGEVISLSAVDSVEALAGSRVDADTELDLREWARPTWRHGTAVLLVQPGHAGLVPFESRHQIPCCSDH